MSRRLRDLMDGVCLVADETFVDIAAYYAGLASAEPAGPAAGMPWVRGPGDDRPPVVAPLWVREASSPLHGCHAACGLAWGPGSGAMPVGARFGSWERVA